VPKLPRISGRECVSVMQRLGFSQVRQRGSHVVMRRGSQGCAVPLHRELKVGTLAGILRQAGVDPEEFVKVLRG
jgi:predicted RNA binding protein YcfA (HicA-like mRNA interferase family)